MFITPGITYRLTFTSGFEDLNGLYTVLKLLSHEEMLADELSILGFYTAAGKTEEEFTADKLLYKDHSYIKIQSIVDTSLIYYTNELLLLNVPDFSAKQYYKLGLTVNLGIFKDENDLSGITMAVDEMLETTYGINSPSALFVHGDVQWLTDIEYANIETARETLKDTVINTHVLINQLSTENTALRQKLADLEKFLLPPTIVNTFISITDGTLHIVFNKPVTRTAGTFTLTGSVSGTITTSYASGNNTATLIHTPDIPVQAGETLTLSYTGPGVTGPTIVGSLMNITNVAVQS